MTGRTEIRHARVVTPSGVVDDGHVVVAGDRIARVGPTPSRPVSGAETVDADGRVLIPGLVDLHGDDIEHHRSPRSGALTDLRTAVTTADRANLLCGVTTKYHAVAFEDAPDDGRTLDEATALADELATEGYTLGDNRLHARCELTAGSVETVERVAAEAGVDLLSVMHHAPGNGQYDDGEFERHYVEDRNWPAEAVDEVAARRHSLGDATRSERIDRVLEIARRVGVPVASHDDDSAAAVEEMAERGVAVSEYPLTLDAAVRAHDLGLATAVGAPNLVRGGSLWDNLAAGDAIDRGVVDVLCADYHPPSLLTAPFVETGESLATRVNRVTRNPADVVGLSDRGRIAVDARADLVLVDPDATPTAERVFVGGTEVVRTGPESPEARQPIPPVGS
ncbi:MAG: alpha-D-ribose 1-methylphosphonate 5-triphosphate diphosphatase [Methanobacteriota archaeon]